jgi:hypothetical protein
MMSEQGRRVFINSELMRNLQSGAPKDADEFLGQEGSMPLYVMMHLRHPAGEAQASPLTEEEHSFLEDQEMEELFDEEDAELIRHLETHPDQFRATPFELDDGTKAVAFDFAQPRLYRMHRVKDEADWRRVMHTYDPTWMMGPAVPLARQRTRLRLRRR